MAGHRSKRKQTKSEFRRNAVGLALTSRRTRRELAEDMAIALFIRLHGYGYRRSRPIADLEQGFQMLRPQPSLPPFAQQQTMLEGPVLGNSIGGAA